MGIVSLAGPGSRRYTVIQGGGGGGSISDGDSVSITSPAALGTYLLAANTEFLKDNIEAGSNGANFSKSGWSLGGSFLPTYSTERSYSGTKSLRNFFSDNDTYQFGIRFDPGATVSKVYVRIPLYIESADGSPGQLKSVRVVGSTCGGGIDDCAAPHIYWTRSWDGAGSMIARHTGDTIYPSSGTVVGDWYGLNGWYLLEFVLQPDSSANAGNGNLKWTHRRLDTGAIVSAGNVTGLFWDAGNRHRYVVLQGYFGNSFDAPGKLFWDAPYIAWRTSGTTEIPHVLLIDSDDYTTRNPQNDQIVPVTAQNGDTLTITAYKGPNASFDNLRACFMRGINDPYSNTAVELG